MLCYKYAPCKDLSRPSWLSPGQTAKGNTKFLLDCMISHYSFQIFPAGGDFKIKIFMKLIFKNVECLLREMHMQIAVAILTNEPLDWWGRMPQILSIIFYSFIQNQFRVGCPAGVTHGHLT